ncbi:cytochrome P450 [Actinomadura rupiterrae]|uniref:cytochrome P450 n=1 Tax=Actinomadura rupiterrae TaxID=559627 RepID=UPI0020A35EA4|nr:cytochrome P450 [Actinomadura rupiterrae]MCP2341575.1 cytochrome P450 [Actinomadura rupiterrae]
MDVEGGSGKLPEVATPGGLPDVAVPGGLPEVTVPSGDVMRAVSAHGDVRRVLADPRFSRELRPGGPRLAKGGDVSDDPYSLLNMDPPRHTRIRRTVSGAFTPRRTAAWRPRVAAIAAELAEEMATRPVPCDLVAAFAFPLPVRVICELLGVPHQDRDRFRVWADTTLSIGPEGGRRRSATGREFRAYVEALVEKRRADPGDALLDALIAARDEEGDGSGLSGPELVSMVINIITAGHETTAHLVATAVFTLVTEGRWPTRVGPELVEEVLRHDTPATVAMPRLAVEDVELASGTVRAGETVLPMIAVANRDAAVFPDPDAFVPERSAGGASHVTFGHGPHFCLGANLARLEVEVALATLAERFPALELAVPAEQVSWRSGGIVSGPDRLPVRW